MVRKGCSYAVEPTIDQPGVILIIKYILFSELREHCDALCKFGDNHKILEKLPGLHSPFIRGEVYPESFFRVMRFRFLFAFLLNVHFGLR